MLHSTRTVRTPDTIIRTFGLSATPFNEPSGNPKHPVTVNDFMDKSGSCLAVTDMLQVVTAEVGQPR